MNVLRDRQEHTWASVISLNVLASHTPILRQETINNPTQSLTFPFVGGPSPRRECSSFIFPNYKSLFASLISSYPFSKPGSLIKPYYSKLATLNNRQQLHSTNHVSGTILSSLNNINPLTSHSNPMGVNSIL